MNEKMFIREIYIKKNKKACRCKSNNKKNSAGRRKENFSIFC